MSGRARVDWYELKLEVEDSLRRCGRYPRSVRIAERVQYLDRGVSFEGFGFVVEADEPIAKNAEALVLRRVCDGGAEGRAAAERLKTEARTLRALEGLPLDFEVPRFVSFVGQAAGRPRAMIETAVFGFPLARFKDGGSHAHWAIDLIGRIAAGVHRLPVSAFPFLDSYPNSSAHFQAAVAWLDDGFPAADADAAEAAAWLRQHRPSAPSAVVLHGDLMPQNVLHEPLEDRTSVMDWEFAKVGDPAHDPAIVTRGNRKLLGVSGGRARLLEAYQRAGGAAIRAIDVLAWELSMALRWLYDSLRPATAQRMAQSPESYRALVRSLLRRAAARSGDP